MTDQEPPRGTVGERIRTLLSERQMSQRQLAALLAGDGAPTNSVENMRRQISSWVNDAHVPSADNAEALGAALDVPPEWFSGDQAKKSMAAALAELADLIDLLGRQAEREAARSEDAAQIVQSLDRRLEGIEALLGQLLEGQFAGSAALAEILDRWNEVDSTRQGTQSGETPN